MNNKGQLGGIAAFIGIVIVLILLAPILLKLAVSMLGTTSTALNNIDTTNKSGDTVLYVQNSITGSMDWVVMLLIVLNILILFVSAFLVDIHPAFLVIYIIGVFVLVLTAPYSIAAAEKVYGMTMFSDPTSGVTKYLPMSEFVLNNFGIIIVGVIIITGILLFAKFGLKSQNQGGIY